MHLFIALGCFSSISSSTDELCAAPRPLLPAAVGGTSSNICHALHQAHHFCKALKTPLYIDLCRVQPEDLKFRQTPTFVDCFPGSEKCYNTVEFNGETMQVRGLRTDVFSEGCD